MVLRKWALQKIVTLKGQQIFGNLGPIHLKDVLSFQAEIFRPEGENLA